MDGKERQAHAHGNREFLAEPVVARIGTIDENGLPYVTPVWQEWDGSAFWIVPRERSAWVAHIKKNPNVAAALRAGVILIHRPGTTLGGRSEPSRREKMFDPGSHSVSPAVLMTRSRAIEAADSSCVGRTFLDFGRGSDVIRGFNTARTFRHSTLPGD